jgi:predicted nucleic acid-binding protein
MTASQMESELIGLKGMFKLLPDKPEIYAAWETLVTTHRVVGKPAHDARPVAAIKVHGLTAVLTFDSAGFSRYPGIRIINPVDVVP